MLYILVIFWLIAISTSADNSSQCITLMKQLVDMPTFEQLQAILPYYSLSGDWMDRFGYYDRCLRLDNGYSTVSVDATILKFNYGICHSNNCTADDFNSNEGQELIKQVLNSTGVADFLKVNLTTAKMTFYNPITFYPDLGWGTYITSALLIILCFMALLDPIQRVKTLCQNTTTEVDVQRTEKRSSPLGLRVGTAEIKQYTPTTIIKDFSIILNYNKIMNLKTIDPNLAIFNGIRAVSFMMVVYGHVNEMTAMSTFQQEILLYFKGWRVVFLYNMMYAVDIFFWVGGFFLGFVMCDDRKAKSMGQNPFSVFLAILHRLLRIWPCYLLCIAINSYIIPYLGSGPRWFLQGGATACPGGAWKNALFIDNFYEDWKICFGWGWYLTCDIQLFLTCLIPILFYCLNYRVFSKILIILMIIGTLGWDLYLSNHYDFLVPGKNTYNTDYYYKYYVSTYARAPPYFLGLLIGVLYREFKSQKQTGKVTYLQQFKDFAQTSGRRFIFQFFCYGVGSGILIFLMFGWKKEFNSLVLIWPKWFQHIYHATCRFLFTFGVTLLVLPNLIGAYDIFNRKLMNNTIFKFMAKISFCMYLVHLMLIVIITETFYETPSFISLDINTGFVCAVAMSAFFGFMLALLVELPFGNLQTRLMKVITRPKRKVDTLLD